MQHDVMRIYREAAFYLLVSSASAYIGGAVDDHCRPQPLLLKYRSGSPCHRLNEVGHHAEQCNHSSRRWRRGPHVCPVHLAFCRCPISCFEVVYKYKSGTLDSFPSGNLNGLQTPSPHLLKMSHSVFELDTMERGRGSHITPENAADSPEDTRPQSEPLASSGPGDRPRSSMAPDSSPPTSNGLNYGGVITIEIGWTEH